MTREIMDENDVLKALEEQDSENEDILEDCEDDSDADPDYDPNPIEEANLEEAILVIENSVEKTKKRSKVNKPNFNEIPTIETCQNIPRESLICFDTDNVVGKNGFIWKSKPYLLPSTSKTTAKNIVHIRPGPTKNAIYASEPLECFYYFSRLIF